MAEIKSAVELALERTKGLRLSHEEMEKMKEEEVQSKAVGLVNRFLEVDFHLRDVEKELAKFDPHQRKHLEQLFLHHLIEAMNLDRDNDLILQGLEAFLPTSAWTFKKIKDLLQRYQRRKKDESQKTQTDLLAGLERLGISGSAVQPKVEGSPEWEQVVATFKPSFEEELKKLKKGILH
jgi:mRNA-degrading endonuclease RelE of RelBE toxin-antitoxin system